MPLTDYDIREIDVVSFKEAVGRWPSGTEGTVVVDFGDDKMVEKHSTYRLSQRQS